MDTYYDEDEFIAEDVFRDVLYEASIDSSNSMSTRPHDEIPNFSEEEAEVLAERLTKKESFKEAQQVLITWLERGDCNESNSALFFSLIQLCFVFTKQLQMEKEECLEEIKNVEKNLLSQSSSICDLKQIGNAIEAMEKNDIWDNFTQSERENLQTMKEDFFHLDLDIENFIQVSKEEEELMEDFKDIRNEMDNLKRDADNLTLRLKAVTEEAKNLLNRKEDGENEMENLEAELEKSKNVDSHSECIPDYVRDNESLIICMISNLLVEHYLSGLSLDYIHTYIRDKFPAIEARDIEMLLRRNPKIFKESVCEQESTWFYAGFDNAV